MDQGTKEKQLDALLIILLSLAFALLFWKVVLAGASISRIHLIAEWDSVFDKFRLGQSQGMDPSLILLMVPYYLFVARSWNNGAVPLWNPNNGFGMPLLADPQSLSFSPLHLPLALSPHMHVYDLILVLELIIMAVGSFLLARCLGLARVTAVFCALTLSLCPYEQWYLELIGNGYCLIPFLFYLFINAAKRQTNGSATLAGIGCAFFLLSAHPELSLCAILFASLMVVLVVPTLQASLRTLFMAGTVAFCLSAPMLLPFLEYLRNADTYKHSSGAPAFMPWQTYVFNMLQPGFGGASPYLGIIVPLALPMVAPVIFRIITKRSRIRPFHRRVVMSMSILSVLAVLLTSKFGPLQSLLVIKPFSYLVVNYIFPVLMVFTTILAGFGLQLLFLLAGIIEHKHSNADGTDHSGTAASSAEDKPASKDTLGTAKATETASPPHLSPQDSTADPRISGSTTRGFHTAALFTHAVDLSHRFAPECFIPLLMAAVVLSFPMLVKVLNIDLHAAYFDMTLPQMALSNQDWLRNFFLIAVFLIALFSFPVMKRRLQSWRFSSYLPTLIAVLCVSLGVFSELAISRKSLPIRPTFNYPQAETIARLKELDGRFIATGDHILRPNTNLAYAIRDLRFHNPLFPKRYLDFMNHAGAKLDAFNQVFSPTISSMLDMASVRYIVTAEHLSHEDPSDDKRFELVARTSDGLEIYRNNGALPEAYIVSEAVFVEEQDQALEWISSDRFDSSKQVVIESAPVQLNDKASTIAHESSVQLTRAGDTTVTIDVATPHPGFLVLTDLWYPGWQATIDGAPAQMYRANYLFRAVQLSPGHHVVSFRYWPYSFMLGVSFMLILSLVGVYFLVKPPRKVKTRKLAASNWPQPAQTSKNLN